MFAKDIRVMTNYFLTLEIYNYVFNRDGILSKSNIR